MKRAENQSASSVTPVRLDVRALAEIPSREIVLIGRGEQRRRLLRAMRDGRSLLIWGPADSGKTALVKNVIANLPGIVRRKCIYWDGPAGVKQLAGGLVGRLCEIGAVRRNGVTSGFGEGWLRKYSCGRLKLILFEAVRADRYCIFLDHMSEPTQPMARFLKEIIWRGSTPVFLLARGKTRAEIGPAWSIYFAPEYQLRMDPVSNSAAKRLLAVCIDRFGLDALHLADFREELLRLSGGLPGAVVKMCELAAERRYHFGNRVKMRLVHVEYRMRAAAKPPGRERGGIHT